MRWGLFDLNGTLLDPSAIAEPLDGGGERRRLNVARQLVVRPGTADR